MERKYIKNINDIEAIHTRSIEERETTINFSYDIDKMSIYTSDNTTMTKLKKCMEENPNEWLCWEGARDSEGNITGYFLEAPKKYLTFRKNSIKLSEENRQKASERFSQMWQKKKEM